MTVHRITRRKKVKMRKRSVKIILGVLAVTAVLGVGVAAAATQPSWGGGNGPQVTRVLNDTRTGDQVRLRACDGTGPRHDQMQSRMQQRMRDGTGPRHGQQSAPNGNRGADCPYRS
jgi:flagellar basal body-associated protein FliL